ncbi:MAG: hypothetical protein CMC81_07370 [Flavobacteriaceae bacterium]|nr:hypothetical protein [Flavobacteriaceae bacterium]|tara:strand:+ start:231 stop:959 length:729 start_codon:yes stop_codon:yes gene_type:complete
MKNYLLLFVFILSLTVNAQVAVFHPIKIPSDQIKKFENVETNYSLKVAQDAVDNGVLVWWGLMKLFNTKADDYNYMWVNVYKDIDAAVSSKASWWNNSEAVVGVKPGILLDGVKGAKSDRRYYYQIRQQIDSGENGKFVIFNFGNPDNVQNVLASNSKYIIPNFKKNMKKSGMTGWGAGTKITPQGSEYSSFMTYDSFDSMANLMKHLSGDGAAMKGIEWTKLEPLTFDSRYVLEVISSTNN